MAPSGTSSGEETIRTPLFSRSATSWGLWMIGPRVQTAFPSSSRRYTALTALFTPKQNPAVFATRISMDLPPVSGILGNHVPDFLHDQPGGKPQIRVLRRVEMQLGGCQRLAEHNPAAAKRLYLLILRDDRHRQDRSAGLGGDERRARFRPAELAVPRPGPFRENPEEAAVSDNRAGGIQCARIPPPPV